MKLAALAVAAVAVLAPGCGGEAETRTVTVTRAPSEDAGVPAEVLKTRAALLRAAETGDYEELRPLLPRRLSYTFGGPFEGGPIAYWRNIEEQTDDRPIAILADLLRLPYTLYRGVYTWPFAFDKQPDELTEYERGLLRNVAGENLSDDFGEGTGYLGWRVGIEANVNWIFFIAGD